MVKKRAKLSGQGKKMFFSDTDLPEEAEKKETPAPSEKSPAGTEETAPSPAIPEDFIKKITALKEMLRQFQTLVDQEEFKKLRGKDIKNYASRE